MSNVHAGQYQQQSSQDIARQRLAAGRQEIMLYTHLLQASLVVERSDPLRQVMMMHPQLVRNMTIMIVILLSAVIGVLAPEISRALWLY